MRKSFVPKSEPWEPPQFQEKRSRSEKAILGALGEFRGILGAALGIRNSILGIRNSILGMASYDLSNTKPTILGATPGAIPGIDGNPHEIFSFAHAFSERFFKIGVVPARQTKAALQRTKNCIATSEKRHCKKVELSCRFPADFKLPRLGSHV